MNLPGINKPSHEDALFIVMARDALPKLLKFVKSIQALVNAQAEDYALWFDAQHATESYLQSALHTLHRQIENPFEEFEKCK